MKNTNKETHNLWFEALRMSDEYRQLCEKFENQAGPFETMSKDDIHPDTVRTFEKFDNILIEHVYFNSHYIEIPFATPHFGKTL